MDEFFFEILADGTIRTTTGAFSEAVHESAEGILDVITKLAGGPVERTRRPLAEAHVHQHDKQREGH